MTIGNKTTAYRYNKNDELLRTDTLHTDTEKNDVVIYKNDKNGNQLAAVNRSEIPAEAKDTSYIDVDVTLGDNQLNDNVVNHYNALNQLTETLTKNYKVSFTYDAEGLRTGKTVNGEKTVYVWDGDQVVMELSKGGAVQKRYIRGNDLVYADKGENTEKTYYVTDMHGNVVQLLDESGNVTKTYEYDSFGNEVKPEKKDENPYRYCGEYYDKETEEVYLRARYYEPGVGRFITRDTYTGESDEPLSLHLYTYCENDGVNMVDPSGHWGKEPKGYGVDYVKYKYTHMNITEEALQKVQKERNVRLSKRMKTYLLFGTILPDRKAAQKGKIKISGEKFTNLNMYHGKNKEALKKLRRRIYRKTRGRMTINKAILIGAFFHSVQDFEAHSYCMMELQVYKKKLKNKANRQLFSDGNKVYHNDWYVEGDKIIQNQYLHKNQKDNPYAVFEKKTYNLRSQNKGKNINRYVWTIYPSRKDNPRYIKKKKNTEKYIKFFLK